MNLYEATVHRITETEFKTYYDLCELSDDLKYTRAVSEAQAINNIRWRLRKELGWKNHDENHGSVSVTYEITVKVVDGHGYEQLKLF